MASTPTQDLQNEVLNTVRKSQETVIDALKTWVETWQGASSERRTEIRRGDDVVCRAATLWAFVALEGGRPRRIPEAIKAAF